MFDKQVIRKNIIRILCIIAIILGIVFIRRTFSRYESNADSGVEADMAFWVVNDSLQESDVYIGEIATGVYKDYTFTVSNFNDTISAKVPIQYRVVVDSTTNMPLQYSLYKKIDGNDTICEQEETIYQDGDGTYFKKLESEEFSMGLVEHDTDKETHTFTLRVTLPNYNEDGLNDGEDDDENWMFADLVEYAKVSIDARQRIYDPADDDDAPTISNANIGDYVNLGSDIVGTRLTTDDWRVLYVESDTVYVILADYLPNFTNYAQEAGLIQSGTYSVSGTSAQETIDILNDPTKWTALTNEITGSLAYGAPTGELFLKSYNAKYGTSLVKANPLNLETDKKDANLYVPQTAVVEGANGFSLAEPGLEGERTIWAVTYNGAVTSPDYENAPLAIRPVIAIPASSVKSIKGIWEVQQ